jgi:peptide/nickel transport system substrate-binding protein
MFIAMLTSCQEDQSSGTLPIEEPPALIEPTATTLGEVQDEGTVNFITIATDAPSRFRDFTDIDNFGNVIGFDPDIMADISADAGFEYEFVVTSFTGLLDSIVNREFSAAMSALIFTEEPQEGLIYTTPYLEVGQVLVVRANEEELGDYHQIRSDSNIGVQRFTSGEQIARELLGLSETDLHLFNGTPEALQALIDGDVQGVIIDSDDAIHFTSSFPQQLKIVGGTGKDAWISSKFYAIAVHDEDQQLLTLFNEAIPSGRLTRSFLIPKETIAAGESLVGTAANEMVIGIAGELNDLDPENREPDLISWEILANTMSGLLMYDAENNLVPILASDFPVISEDKLEYTLSLKSGLTFPDNSELTANDVKFSINRAASMGNFQINNYLKDANEDNFADEDAVQVIDPLTVKFVLKEPASFFPNLLATPPYFVTSEACVTTNTDPFRCGLGSYTITEWDIGEQMRLKANPQWPGSVPAFENIQIRFYQDTARMRRSLENSAIDVAWTGLQQEDALELRDNPDLIYWEGPATFKSYIVFEQGEMPWSDARIREAVALSVDREALASEVFDESRQALYSPVPNDTPGHLATEPTRDLVTARSILTAAGYNPNDKLSMEIWYVNDGRYTDREEAYALAIEEQLEETGLIDVVLQGAPWDVFRPQSLACNYQAYLLGWPSSGQPAAYLDPMTWIEYFITNTDSICSNYESQEMEILYKSAMEETDPAQRFEIYQRIQELWARDFPTLDLTQEPRVAVSLPNVQDFKIDAIGLLHYDLLTKSGG